MTIISKLGLDPKTRKGIWEMIKKMKEGRVIIMTTHAMDEADALSDRIGIINRG